MGVYYYAACKRKITNMTLEKYILDILKNDLLLNLNNTEPRRKLFEYPKNFYIVQNT